MKERPILFSAPMVRAILEGRKTQTRRVVKPGAVQMIEFAGGRCDDEPMTEDDFIIEWTESYDDDGGKRKKYPAQWCVRSEYPEEGILPLGTAYGQPGDRLWVREAWGVGTRPHPVDGLVDGIEYRADEHYLDEFEALPLNCEGIPDDVDLDRYRGKWRPSIHMPRWASRITLEIVSVRVERLNEISEQDAGEEGFDYLRGDGNSDISGDVQRKWFRKLWESINGTGSWQQNPWCWVIGFKRVPQ